MKSSWISSEVFEKILKHVEPENALILRICMTTGLRIGDVLRLKLKSLKNNSRRISVTEQKTGKARRVYLQKDIWNTLQTQYKSRGGIFIFQGRHNPTQTSKTRQSVYRALKKALKVCEGFLPEGKNISVHSTRKMYAVSEYLKTGDLNKVQQRLNHDNVNTTLAYLLDYIMESKK